MLKGMMMDRQLSIPAIIDLAAEVHPDTEIVSVATEGGIHRTTYKDIRKRIARLAHGLRALGVKPGSRLVIVAADVFTKKDGREKQTAVALATIAVLDQSSLPLLRHAG